MAEYMRMAIFAKSAMGGLYIGVQEAYDDTPQECYDPLCDCGGGVSYPPRPIFYRLPDNIGEEELLGALKSAQATGEIDDKYKVHMKYRGGGRNSLSYLMKHDDMGPIYQGGATMRKIERRWEREAEKANDVEN